MTRHEPRKTGDTIRVSEDRKPVMSPGSPFNALAAKYDSWYDGKGRFAFQSELAAVRLLLDGLDRPWLEIGVGTGRFAQALGIEHGLDPSEELLKLARQRGVDVLWGEGEETPYRAQSFGAVFLLTTWAFLEDRAAVLRECRRILRPGGRVINGWLDRDGAWTRGYVEKGKQEQSLFSRARFATLEEVRIDFEAAGFRVERVVSTLFLGPGECDRVEEPKEGYKPGASFVALRAVPT
ncbi:methyltransferase domain-containing protein [candidate division WOR-3 bacterium]|nr:methyltransferase domain-containing protein [candidate division WOR-3 bacterium]